MASVPATRRLGRLERAALQGVLAECAADEACNKAFPNIKSETKAVLERLMKGPVEVEFQPQGLATSVKVTLSRNLAAEAVRYMLYNPGGASRVPLVLHQAAEGNFAPLAQIALRFRRTLVGTGSNGMYLTVTCAEDVPWAKRTAGESERTAQNTFLGDYLPWGGGDGMEHRNSSVVAEGASISMTAELKPLDGSAVKTVRLDTTHLRRREPLPVPLISRRSPRQSHEAPGSPAGRLALQGSRLPPCSA